MKKSRIINALVIGVMWVSICYSQQAEEQKKVKNAITFNPLGIALGTIGGNYEHLFGDRHGLMVQALFPAGYALSKGTGMAYAMQYRYHYFKKDNQQGMNSPFWGPFVYFENSTTEVKVKNEATYDVDIEYFKAGASMGRRWIWNNSFTLVYRIGYGIPFYSKYTWSPVDPDEAETIEQLTTVIAGIDAEFTIGFAF